MEQKKSNKTTLDIDDSYYRFAFVGTSSSGKTCILAKIAMGADVESERFSSTLIPIKFPPLTDEEKRQRDNDPMLRERDNYYTGQEKIKEARKQLEKKQCPKATTIEDDSQSLVNFDMSETNRGNFNVQTEDYPGELLKPEYLQDKNSCSSFLCERLSEFDGLIIVVETSNNEYQEREIREHIKNLNSYFSAINENLKKKKRREQTPVALIFSKWDRYATPINFDSPEEERKKLEDFLQKKRFYNELKKTVEAMAQVQDGAPTEGFSAGIAVGNSALFPVSAFGTAISQNGMEVPDPNCDRSFGLIEPFYWLAQRRDELDLCGLEKEAGKIFLGLISPLAIKKCRQTSAKLANRLPKHSDAEKRLKVVRSKLFKQTLQFRAFWFAVLFMIACGAMLWNTHTRFNTWETLLNESSASIDDLEKTQKKVSSYIQTPHLYFSPSKTKAEELLTKYDVKIDNQYYEQVKAASTLAEITEAAKQYRDNRPNGKHLDQINGDLTKMLEENDKLAWDSVMNAASVPLEQLKKANEYLRDYSEGLYRPDAVKIVSEINASLDKQTWDSVLAAASVPLEQLKKANDYLQNYPEGLYRPDAVKIIGEINASLDKQNWERITALPSQTEEQITAAQEYLQKFPNGQYRDDAKNLIGQYNVKIKIDSLEKEYHEALQSSDLTEMYNTLIGLINETDISASSSLGLIENYPGNVLNILEKDQINNTKPTQIKQYADAKTSFKTLQIKLREKGKLDIADAYEPKIVQCNQKRSELIDRYDQELYNIILSSPTKNHCQDYLGKMGTYNSGAMIQPVKEYLTALEKEEGIQENVEFTFKVDLADNTEFDARYKIWINNTEQYNKLCDFPPGKISGSTSMNIDPKKTIRVGVSIIGEDNWKMWWNGTTLGEGSKDVSLKELGDPAGCDISLSNWDNKSAGTMNIKAELPERPELPEWKK